MREKGIKISCISTELVSIEETQAQRNYIREKRGLPLIHQNFVTCLTRVFKQREEEKSQQMLVVGTEQATLFFLAPSGTEVKSQLDLPAVPVQLHAEGTYDVDYKLFAACRNGCVYVIAKDKIESVIKAESKPVCFLKVDKNVMVASIDNQITSYGTKGKKNWSV